MRGFAGDAQDVRWTRRSILIAREGRLRSLVKARMLPLIKPSHVRLRKVCLGFGVALAGAFVVGASTYMFLDGGPTLPGAVFTCAMGTFACVSSGPLFLRIAFLADRSRWWQVTVGAGAGALSAVVSVLIAVAAATPSLNSWGVDPLRAIQGGGYWEFTAASVLAGLRRIRWWLFPFVAYGAAAAAFAVTSVTRTNSEGD